MFAEELGTQCLNVYQSAIDGFTTQESRDSWMQQLEDELAELCDLDTQRNATSKVIDISDELVNIVWEPWFTMLFACLLTTLIRVTVLRGTTSTSFSSSVQSTLIVFKRRRCLGLV
jgi:hypothetical protein